MIKVLLADDHQMMTAGIRAFLEKEKEMEVVAEARNGSQVLTILNNTPVDVAVLDIEMPEMDGIETAKAIKRDFPNVKILMLTMYDKGVFIIKLLQAGAHGYLLKNKSKEALVGAIHAIYGGSRYFPPDILAKTADTPHIEEEKLVKLTTREKEVLSLIGEALPMKKIADQLNISKTTVIFHNNNLRFKLGIPNIQGLVKYAIKHGYTKL